MTKHYFRVMIISLIATIVLLPCLFFISAENHFGWVGGIVFGPPSLVSDYLVSHQFIKNTEVTAKKWLLSLTIIYFWISMFLFICVWSYLKGRRKHSGN
jgi:hypothetical protein